MNKITISTPVFYKESFGTPLYQLLAYDAHNDEWFVQDVIRGCEAPKLTNIDLSKVSFKLETFTRDGHTGEMREVVQATIVHSHLISLGVPVHDILNKAIREKFGGVCGEGWKLPHDQFGKLDLSLPDLEELTVLK